MAFERPTVDDYKEVFAWISTVKDGSGPNGLPRSNEYLHMVSERQGQNFTTFDEMPPEYRLAYHREHVIRHGQALKASGREVPWLASLTEQSH